LSTEVVRRSVLALATLWMVMDDRSSLESGDYGAIAAALRKEGWALGEAETEKVNRPPGV
jgi:hypothetical protein